VDFVVAESPQLDLATRSRLRQLWDQAFGDRFTDANADHAFGGVHVLARDSDRLIGHASAVPRMIRFGDEPWRQIGYVEAVAVDPGRQRSGVGRRTMEVLHAELASRWPAALLSTGRATGFYESLGWHRWRGPTFTETATGLVQNHNHGGLMILRFDPTIAPDVSASVICEDRPGNSW
jgi:aminoglycoside 2'-N-acetyltransferase I